MIQGLTYQREWITPQHEASLLARLDEQAWSTELKRRVQHYGYKYNYKSRSVGEQDFLGPLPSWADSMALMLAQDKIMLPEANQVIVNEYLPGQGIGNHIDCEPCFGNIVCSVSLGAPVVMDFINKNDPVMEVGKSFRLLLEPRSLLVIKGPARFYWTHGIQAKKVDTWKGQEFARERRISITFRTVVDEFMQIDDPMIISMRALDGILGVEE